MPSLTKKDNSPYWFCCFTTPDGKRTKRSTKQTDKKKAMAVCGEFEKASKKAKIGILTENQAIKVVSDIKNKSLPLKTKLCRDVYTENKININKICFIVILRKNNRIIIKNEIKTNDVLDKETKVKKSINDVRIAKYFLLLM